MFVFARISCSVRFVFSTFYKCGKYDQQYKQHSDTHCDLVPALKRVIIAN